MTDFDAILNLESEWEEEGRQAGEKEGKRQGVEQGREIGIQKGRDLGHELGYYAGCAECWLRLYDTQGSGGEEPVPSSAADESGDKPKARKVLEQGLGFDYGYCS
mmetsp:Transcript_19414/g.30391  ORF Transcript_19414/g.30391 Transcript_19414/m.30391 type:complete len:105 (-) Transcript_19414:2147-2461(-)